MILATSADNRVMARSVLIVHDEPDIYIFTWKYSRKTIQIEKNNHVALSKDKVSIEGKAEILGLMTDEKNKEILEFLRTKQPKAIARWENKPNMIIIKIRPEFACVDGYSINREAYLEYVDFTKQSAHREKWGCY